MIELLPSSQVAVKASLIVFPYSASLFRAVMKSDISQGLESNSLSAVELKQRLLPPTFRVGFGPRREKLASVAERAKIKHEFVFWIILGI